MTALLIFVCVILALLCAGLWVELLVTRDDRSRMADSCRQSRITIRNLQERLVALQDAERRRRMMRVVSSRQVRRSL